MRDLLRRPWVRSVGIGCLILLELLFLLLMGRWLPPVSESGHSAYEELVTINITSLGDLRQRCEVLDEDPLYPMLLYGVMRLLPDSQGYQAAGILQVPLAIGIWLLLFFMGRQLLSRRAAFLTPLLFCCSAAFVSALTRATPALLCMLLFTGLACFYLDHLRLPIRALSGVLLFGIVLLGILADYGFFFLAMGLCLPFTAVALLRGRTSDAVSAPVYTLGAMLAAVVLFPGYINRSIALFRGEGVTLSYGASLAALWHGLSQRIFGGIGLVVLSLLFLTILAAVIVDAMRPKKDAEEVAADPSRAAYQRRIARRNPTHSRTITLSRNRVSLLILATGVVAVWLLLPLYPRWESFRALDPFCALLTLALLYHTLPKFIRSQTIRQLINVLFPLLLSALSYLQAGWRG